jgi:hypothetical protein
MVTLGALMVLAAGPDGGAPTKKLLGEQYGVPVYEPDQPWTREVPSHDGTIAKSDVRQSSAADGTLSYEADRLTFTGASYLELATKKVPSRRVSVQLKVEQGKIRVFLRYALDVAVFCEAAAPSSCSLEGVVWQSNGLKPAVLLQSLAGEAVVSGFSVKSK